jgi:hypothetical protein
MSKETKQRGPVFYVLTTVFICAATLCVMRVVDHFTAQPVVGVNAKGSSTYQDWQQKR